MFDLFQMLKPKVETTREKALSNQVDHLEFELAKARRELEAANIQKSDIKAQFETHRLRDYPAAGSWVKDVSISDFFNSKFENPVEYVLADVEALGYDVSAAWMVHRAMLDLAKQHETGVIEIQNMVNRLSKSRAKLN
ncbi:hypothetical protein BGP77_11495 [Saccharospirillum sp. MSK14-1]|uniref:hypothetical protein n=1 Tax=Saccharospirillum sp. MSK14-1 TaxID=1897632 RepID=UPI000D35100C|nr:hypothetical protein [Saccharospirillum sp. MSK14-1]PTY38564.1 hypothetical protein BGP77_11495 [Saccharospirillum sp. MSK14-1]